MTIVKLWSEFSDFLKMGSIFLNFIQSDPPSQDRGTLHHTGTGWMCDMGSMPLAFA